MAKNLLTPIQVGSLQLKNRVIMPPLTRIRAGPSHLPNDLMKEYYAQRASAGLIVAESAMIEPNSSCFYGEPGVYTDEQLAKWKEITDAVHAKGGKIFVQIYHGGRAAHPFFNNGAECVGPSPIAIVNEEVHTPEGKKKHVAPRELTVDEISAIVELFATVAKKCVDVAGFDGVEVQASGGFLIDSFLKKSANQRTDQYGGDSLENRTRFLAEVFQAVTDAVGADKVGVKYSILGGYNDMYEDNPLELSEEVAKVSQRFNVAYVHLARKDVAGKQLDGLEATFRKHFHNTFILSMGFTKDEANEVIASGLADAVSFGSLFIANPDLPERFAKDAPLNPVDPSTFYLGEAKGYTDYPTLSA